MRRPALAARDGPGEGRLVDPPLRASAAASEGAAARAFGPVSRRGELRRCAAAAPDAVATGAGSPRPVRRPHLSDRAPVGTRAAAGPARPGALPVRDHRIRRLRARPRDLSLDRVVLPSPAVAEPGAARSRPARVERVAAAGDSPARRAYHANTHPLRRLGIGAAARRPARGRRAGGERSGRAVAAGGDLGRFRRPARPGRPHRRTHRRGNRGQPAGNLSPRRRARPGASGCGARVSSGRGGRRAGCLAARRAALPDGAPARPHLRPRRLAPGQRPALDAAAHQPAIPCRLPGTLPGPPERPARSGPPSRRGAVRADGPTALRGLRGSTATRAGRCVRDAALRRRALPPGSAQRPVARRGRPDAGRRRRGRLDPRSRLGAPRVGPHPARPTRGRRPGARQPPPRRRPARGVGDLSPRFSSGGVHGALRSRIARFRRRPAAPVAASTGARRARRARVRSGGGRARLRRAAGGARGRPRRDACQRAGGARCRADGARPA